MTERSAGVSDEQWQEWLDYRHRIESSPVFDCRRGAGAEVLSIDEGCFLVTDDRGRLWYCLSRRYAEMRDGQFAVQANEACGTMEAAVRAGSREPIEMRWIAGLAEEQLPTVLAEDRPTH